MLNNKEYSIISDYSDGYYEIQHSKQFLYLTIFADRNDQMGTLNVGIFASKEARLTIRQIYELAKCIE